MKHILIAACLAACYAVPAVSPVVAETAKVSLSGTYAPLPNFPAGATMSGQGGSFSTTLDYDSARTKPNLSNSTFGSNFYNFSGFDVWDAATHQVYNSGRGFVQGPTIKVSPGVYDIIFIYTVGPMFTWQWCEGQTVCFEAGPVEYQPQVLIGMELNLGTDTSGYFDLTGVSATPKAISSICPYSAVANIGNTAAGAAAAANTTAMMSNPVPASVNNPNAIAESYSLTGTATLSGNYYINTSKLDQNNYLSCIKELPWQSVPQ